MIDDWVLIIPSIAGGGVETEAVVDCRARREERVKKSVEGGIVRIAKRGRTCYHETRN